jgi:putative membrane protein
MRNLLIRWFILTLAIGVTARFMPGVRVEGDLQNLLIIALVFGLVNAFVRPILSLLSCGLIILTLGLFTLVINTAMFLLTAQLMPALKVEGFWAAFWASLVISLITAILSSLIDRDSGLGFVRD